MTCTGTCKGTTLAPFYSYALRGISFVEGPFTHASLAVYLVLFEWHYMFLCIYLSLPIFSSQEPLALRATVV